MHTTHLEQQVASIVSQTRQIPYDNALWHVKQILPYLNMPTGVNDAAEEVHERLLEFGFPNELLFDQ